MTKITGSYRTVARIFALIGVVLLVPALIMFTISAASGGVRGLTIAGAAMSGNSAIWLIIGSCFNIYVRKAEAKAERLKSIGDRFEAEIVKVKINAYVRVNRGVSAYAECTYRNQRGEVCLVRSDSFILGYGAGMYGEKDALRAEVYVNPNDPGDYYVEVAERIYGDIQYDRDYR